MRIIMAAVAGFFVACLIITALAGCQPIAAKDDGATEDGVAAAVMQARAKIAESASEPEPAPPEADPVETVAAPEFEQAVAVAEPAPEEVPEFLPPVETPPESPPAEYDPAQADPIDARLTVWIHWPGDAYYCGPCHAVAGDLRSGEFPVPDDVAVKWSTEPTPQTPGWDPEAVPLLRVFDADGRELRRMLSCPKPGDWHWLLTGEYRGEVTTDAQRLNLVAANQAGPLVRPPSFPFDRRYGIERPALFYTPPVRSCSAGRCR